MYDVDSLPPRLQRELREIVALQKSDGAPIADTYNRLQGIPFLKAARSDPALIDPHERMYIALCQARTISFFNAIELLSQVSVRTGANATAHNLRWVRAILNLSLEMGVSCNTLRSSIGSHRHESENVVINELVSCYNDAQAHFVEKNIKSAHNAIENEYLLSPISVSIHELKSISHFISIELSEHASWPDEDTMAYNILYWAVHSLKTKKKTYLTQFRLFHQIPEIISVEILNIMTAMLESIELKNYSDATELAGIANLGMKHISSSLTPLTTFMYPSEYYSIRAHLGRTSGSRSKNISTDLISRAYIQVSRTLNNPQVALPTDLHMALRSFASSVHHWRNLHMMLPRNILGHDVASLIGSPDAYAEVMRRRNVFEKRAGLRTGPAKGSPKGLDDDRLVEITGSVTRGRFEGVERRAGKGRQQG